MSSPRRLLWRLLGCSLALATLAGAVAAEIPQVISYQGRVTDAGGNPVSDGAYTMRFRIYDAATGGSMVWDSDDQSITVTGGVFNVLLGESPQPTIGLDFGQDYWLLVRFDGVDQAPRQRLTSIGYSYMASGLVAGTEVSGSVISGTGSAIKATNTASTGYAYGVWGESASSSRGYGVYGIATATSGITYGVYGTTYSADGYALRGHAFATTGSTHGVYGSCASTAGYGVEGLASALVGATRGVSGQSHSSNGVGVYGYAISQTGYTYGVYGRSDSPSRGHGVYGEATATSGYTYGVYGKTYSTTGKAVCGEGIAATGYTVGVFGSNESAEGVGVEGRTNASTGTSSGVLGANWSPSGHGVYYQGGLAGSGSKSCVVQTSRGPSLMYCQESPENWFEDFGEGLLVDGQAHIDLDPLFLETVTVDAANPMKVFVELGDECNGVFVRRGATGFEVVELHGGSSSAPFCYRVVAKRKGYEQKRLDYCKAAETDSYLYPELREQERRQRDVSAVDHGMERAQFERE